jgi:predicted kinase
MLATGISPIVDAVNSVEVARDMWRRLSAKHGVSLIVVECTVSDSALHASRLAVRERGLALAEPTWETVDSRRAEWAPWTDPHLTLDGVDDLAENVRRVLAELDRASR